MASYNLKILMLNRWNLLDENRESIVSRAEYTSRFGSFMPRIDTTIRQRDVDGIAIFKIKVKKMSVFIYFRGVSSLFYFVHDVQGQSRLLTIIVGKTQKQAPAEMTCPCLADSWLLLFRIAKKV